ncbi:hypothetical protein DFJ63DRAFT_318847 [Scheffersomyces coipomensis]|uniref:uncharacterized protein n=1 Tax=Scheffersomyces coipomensis TaxID=1788519 RepID=UPI00315DAE0C
MSSTTSLSSTANGSSSPGLGLNLNGANNDINSNGNNEAVSGLGIHTGTTPPLTDDVKVDSKKKRRKSSNANELISIGILGSTTSLTSLNASAIDDIHPIKSSSSPNISPTTTIEENPSLKNLSPTTSNGGNNSVQPNAQGSFPCSECDKQFKRSEHLKRHIRSVHSNIRPFHCKFCDKKFSRSDNLAQHLKTHYRIDNEGHTNIVYGNNPSSSTTTKPLSSSSSSTKKK